RDRRGDERDPADRDRAGATGRPDRLTTSATFHHCIPRFFTRNANRSACSSITLLVGLPAPCPAFVSISIRTGCGPACAPGSAAPHSSGRCVIAAPTSSPPFEPPAMASLGDEV